MKSKHYVTAIAIVSTALLLSSCGGGGTTSNPAGQTGSTSSFPLKSAFVTSLSSGSIQDISVTGSCTGTGRTIKMPATTATTFEGVAALSSASTMKLTLSGCNPASVNQITTAYYDSNLVPLGSSGTSYAVYQSAPNLPITATVGATGTYGSQLLYTNSAKTTASGSAIQTYMVEEETATTAIVNLTTKLYDGTGVLTATEQDHYRIDSSGNASRVWDDVKYASGVHLVLTYTTPSPTAITITPSSAAAVIGSTTNFIATGTYSNGDIANISSQVIWTSTNINVAIINTDGLASSLNEGSTNVTASMSGKTSNSAVLTSTLPKPPSGVFAVSGNVQVTVTWPPVIGASSHNIYWGTAPGITTASNKLTGAISPYVHNGLISGNTYYYRVSTVSSQGEFLSDETFAYIYTGGNPLGVFSANGSLTTARGRHTATLLPNGKILVTGGYGTVPVNSAHPSAEIYDPATGIFTATGNMTIARDQHSATLLPNGKVLIIGGSSSMNVYLASAEIYDPATGIFTATGSMGSGRSYATATLLSNGKVLVTGGIGPSYRASAEIYDPTTGIFTATGSMLNTRYVHTATLLPNGKVVVIGGDSASGYIASAEIFDPLTGLFTATGSLAAPRYNHSASLLPNGKVLVIGGYGAGALSSAEIYDPATGLFSATGSMSTARGNHTATLLSNGLLLVIGGTGISYLASVERYDMVAGNFTATGNMIDARNNHTSTLLPNGSVVVVGGQNTGTLAGSELYQ